MTRDEAVASLNKHADAIRTMGATALYLFGSTVRNQAGACFGLLQINLNERLT